MLDDQNVLKQRDPTDALGMAATQFEQARFFVDVNDPDHDSREITKVVVVGMGGSALGALLLKAWLRQELTVPFEVVQTYTLPEYVDYNTLVIASSYSGYTKETLAGLSEARARSAQIAVVTAGGTLEKTAKEHTIARVILPGGLPQRMTTIFQLRALTALLAHFGVTNLDRFAEIADTADWLGEQTLGWLSGVSTAKNYAKQLAVLGIGKTPVVYGGDLTSAVAYKWKISWNEHAKNVAFWGAYPDVSHNEIVGWTSHPIEKPFAVLDIVSSFEDERVLKQFEITDKLLSGKRPKATQVELKGDTVLKQLLWGCLLADFVGLYAAVLNGVDPAPVQVIEKLKSQLAD